MANETYFQHYAEVIGEQDDAQVTIVRIRGNDCLYEWDNGVDAYRGWFRDGESIADINWKAEPKDGWPRNLS